MKLESISSNSAVKWLIETTCLEKRRRDVFFPKNWIWRHGEVGICNHVCHLYQFIYIYISSSDLIWSLRWSLYLKSWNCHLYQCIILRFDMKPPWKGQGLAHGSHYFRELSKVLGWIWWPMMDRGMSWTRTVIMTTWASQALHVGTALPFPGVFSGVKKGGEVPRGWLNFTKGALRMASK